jgi:hypothetical protein
LSKNPTAALSRLVSAQRVREGERPSESHRGW